MLSQETAGGRIQSVQWNQMPLPFLLEIAEGKVIKIAILTRHGKYKTNLDRKIVKNFKIH